MEKFNTYNNIQAEEEAAAMKSVVERLKKLPGYESDDKTDLYREAEAGIEANRRFVDLYLNKFKLKEIDDEQVVNFLEISHEDGSMRKLKTTAGDLRKQLEDFVYNTEDECLLLNFGDECVNLHYHNYHEVEQITPEVIERERNEKTIEDLQARGVPKSIFCETRNENLLVNEIKYTPEEILQYAQIIKKYYEEHENKAGEVAGNKDSAL